jgi:hypothetical protein
MMKPSEIIFEVVESVEGGYEARALSASIFTEADTIPELEEAVLMPFIATSMKIRYRPSFGCTLSAIW